MGMGIAFFYEKSMKPFFTMKISGEYLGSNNEAEYLAIKGAVAKLLTFKKNITGAVIYSDSEIVIRQLQGRYKVNAPKLLLLNTQINNMLKYMENKSIIFDWVPRTNPRQKIVDRLSKQANPYFNHENIT
jgi:ribonuclease HI